MPEFPSDPDEMMALLGQLNGWLTRVLKAYRYPDITQGEKSGIENQVRWMLDDEFPASSHVVSWGGPGPLPPPLPQVGFPCLLCATPELDDLIAAIEDRMSHGE